MILADYITSRLTSPFIWGENDCVLFAEGWVRASTGKDYLADIPKWRSMLEAHRILRRFGGLESVVNMKLATVSPNYARDGDVGLYKGSLMLFTGHHIVGPGVEGLMFVSRMEAKCAWLCA